MDHVVPSVFSPGSTNLPGSSQLKSRKGPLKIKVLNSGLVNKIHQNSKMLYSLGGATGSIKSDATSSTAEAVSNAIKQRRQGLGGASSVSNNRTTSRGGVNPQAFHASYQPAGIAAQHLSG